ncbi:MAG: F-box protein [Nitrososphaerota archaeon]
MNSIPIEICNYILSFIVDDNYSTCYFNNLHYCSSVCKTWKILIKQQSKHSIAYDFQVWKKKIALINVEYHRFF